MRLELVGTFVLASHILLCGCLQRSKPTANNSSTKKIAVSMEIQFNGHGDDQTLEVKAPSGTTVFGALKQLTTENRISAQLAGTGDTGFVSSIGGVAQERGGGKGWTFRVNDDLAKVGPDKFELNEGDHVVWRYGRYKPD